MFGKELRCEHDLRAVQDHATCYWALIERCKNLTAYAWLIGWVGFYRCVYVGDDFLRLLLELCLNFVGSYVPNFYIYMPTKRKDFFYKFSYSNCHHY